MHIVLPGFADLGSNDRAGGMNPVDGTEIASFPNSTTLSPC
jgi:hypothetical protein